MKIRWWENVPLRAPDGGGGGGGGGEGAFLASLPEAVRGHEALKGVKDAGDLASRFVSEVSRPFAERLPEDLRADPAFKDFRDVGALAKSYKNQEKLLGVPREQLLRVPDEKDEAGWNGVYDRLGRPAAADKYALPKLAQGQEYSDADRAFQGAMLPAIHKAGLSQKQLDVVMGAWNQYADKIGKDLDAAQAARIASATETLKKDFGAAFDGKMAEAEAAIVYFSQTLKLGDSLSAELKESGLNNHPAIIKLFAALGAGLKEDGKLEGRAPGGAAGELTPESAKAEIASLKNDAKFMAAYGDKGNAEHAAAVERMRRLHEQAFPAA